MSAIEEHAADSSLQWALRTVSTVKDDWQHGTSPDLAGVLETYPGLKKYPTLVVDLAYVAYRLRQQAGEDPDAGEFAQRFRTFERAIACYLMVCSIRDKDPRYAAMQSDVAWPEAGSRYLGFDLVREIGRGAVGRVFLATEGALGGRQVVVKVTVEGGHEANILGQLEHANIVPIHSIQADEAGKLTAFCMPYHGQATLSGVLDHVYAERRPPSRASAILSAIQAVNEGEEVPHPPPTPDRVLRHGSYVEGVVLVGAQLAEALAHAHARGIFHRDLKPQNILMAPDGRPLVLDFNLSVDNRTPDWRIGGTLPYMAPEQLWTVCKPRTAAPCYDARSDLFSLGVILYEMLAGSMPFGEIKQEFDVRRIASRLWKRQAKGPRPLRQRNRQVDARLAGLIESCLAFDPQNRPASADALAAALRKELTPFRRVLRWAAAHRGLVLTAVLATLFLVMGVATYLVLRPPYPVRQFRQGLAYYEAGQDDLALQSLNSSLVADPRSSDALIARGRVHVRCGDFQLAFADYDAARRIAPSSSIDAYAGYCLSQMGQYQQATLYHRRAIEGGFDSAGVRNNLGYSWLRLGRLDDAEDCLRQAVRTDDRLQAAHHNLVMVHLQRALAGTAIPAAAFTHARRAQEIGPESGELCRDLALFYALAAKQDAVWERPAIDCIAKAVAHGIDPQSLKSDPVFSDMENNSAFQDALIRRGPPQGAIKAVRVIDPAGEAR